MSDFVARLDSKPLFVSDELPHYANTLADAFHNVDITDHRWSLLELLSKKTRH